MGDNKTAVIESASACGLSLVPLSQRNPLITTTYGIGQLINESMKYGCKKILIGCGDSSTNDGGAGAIQALGTRLLDDKKIKNEQEFTLQRDAIQNQYDIDKINLQNSLKVQTAQNDSTPQIISDTVNQIMSNPEANTPILTRAVLSELVGNKAISSGTRAKIAPAVEVLNAVEELAGLNQEGKFTGSGGIFGLAPLGQWFKGIFNAQDTEYVNNRQALEAINLKAQQWASGAALTEAQTKQVQKFTPNVYDSDKQMRTKINGLYNFMLNQAEANLLTEGINVQFPSVNLFETYDLMKKASPEQRKELEKLLNQQ